MKNHFSQADKIQDILTRGVEEVIDKAHLEGLLKSKVVAYIIYKREIIEEI